MKSGLARGPISIGASLALVMLLIGCGGGGESNQAFLGVLRGLKHAAYSNESYNAVRRAKSLETVEKDVVTEFCNNVWQVRADHEVHLARGNRPYMVDRITRYAAYHRAGPFLAHVSADIEELQTVIDLGSLDNERLKRYIEACYH
jgi:hypothetical protein